MIRGHVYPPADPGSPGASHSVANLLPDPLGHAFQELRTEMIRREADHYPALEKTLYREAGANRLTVRCNVHSEDEEDQLRDFILSLEDNSYGYLFWQVDTDREAALLNSVDVACMSIQGPDGELLP